MYTFGFSFKPWTDPKVVSEAEAIRAYLNETVDEFGVRDHIRFGHQVTSCAWDSGSATWTASVADREGRVFEIGARYLFMCCGYYNYETGYTPELPGLADFAGPVVHPQHWPEELDYQGKRLAVIGSGATAVTLIPALAQQAAKVTMIQRSPSYIISRPGKDRIANLLNALLPARWAGAINRWRFVRLQHTVYTQSREKPEKVRDYLLKRVRKALGEDYDVEKHFTPSYEPWTQRLCLVPDNDLFVAIKEGRADVVTGKIDRIGETGVRMEGGDQVQADILVTATGLNLQALGGVRLFRDGEEFDPARRGQLPRHDVLGPAQPVVHLRLHQFILDLARGPEFELFLQAAQGHGRQRRAALRSGAWRKRKGPARARLGGGFQSRLYATRDAFVPETKGTFSLAQHSKLRARPRVDRQQPHRRRRPAT